MGRNNILFLHETARIGGAENSLISLITNIHKDVFTPFFICSEEGILVDEIKKLGIETEIINMPKVRRLNGVITAIRKINGFIKNRKISLVHSQSIRTHVYGTIAAKFNGIPVIWHERNLITNEIIDPDRFLSVLPDKIICNSEAIRKRFEKSMNWHKTVTIFNGIDTKIFNPDLKGDNIRNKYGLKRDEIVIGISSRFDTEKGHEYFLKAAKIVLAKHKNIKFLVVGSGVFKEHIERENYLKTYTEKLGISNNVIFTGFLNGMQNIYAAMNVLVLASFAEPFGRVTFEAMACGKPVIGTNIGGTPEIVIDGKTGILIPPKDENKLAEAVIKLLDNQEMMRQMGKAGRKRVEELFSIERHVQRIEQIYKEVLSV